MATEAKKGGPAPKTTNRGPFAPRLKPNATSEEMVALANEYAAFYHEGQQRKNKQASPYIEHPRRVERSIREAGITSTRWFSETHVRMAALLHDVLEDTWATPGELGEVFGAHILGIVQELSDDKALGKVDRKRKELARALTISPAATIIKLADKLDNCSDIFTDPPTAWSAEERRGYTRWAYAVCRNCAGVLPGLDAKATAFFEANGIKHTPADLALEIQRYYDLLSAQPGGLTPGGPAEDPRAVSVRRYPADVASAWGFVFTGPGVALSIEASVLTNVAWCRLAKGEGCWAVRDANRVEISASADHLTFTRKAALMQTSVSFPLNAVAGQLLREIELASDEGLLFRPGE